MSASTPRSTAQKILRAITDLTSTNQTVTRQSIAMETHLKLSVVDDHVQRLKEGGQLVTLTYGVFKLVAQDEEDRAVSNTLLPNGRCKLEVGDICLDLSMREARLIAMATGGVALAFGRER